MPPGQAPLKPRYDLTRLKTEIKSAEFGTPTALRRAREGMGGGSDAQVEAFIKRVVCALEPEKFFESRLQRSNIVADVYGHRDEHGDWYVKFYEDDGVWVIASCHAPEKDFKCWDGTEMRARP